MCVWGVCVCVSGVVWCGVVVRGGYLVGLSVISAVCIEMPIDDPSNGYKMAYFARQMDTIYVNVGHQSFN